MKSFPSTIYIEQNCPQIERRDEKLVFLLKCREQKTASTEFCDEVTTVFIGHFLDEILMSSSVTRKKLPNVYKSCQKMISLEK